MINDTELGLFSAYCTLIRISAPGNAGGFVLAHKEKEVFENKKRTKIITVVLFLLLSGIIAGGLFFLSEKSNRQQQKTDMAESGEVSEPKETEKAESRINPEDVIKTLVYLENKDNYSAGNGCVYQITEDTVIIVTTWHLLENSESISVWFHDNAYAEGSVMGVNEKHDVGFVKIPRKEVPDETVKRIKAIQRNDRGYDLLKQGDEISYPFLSYDGVFVCQESRIGTIASMNWYVEEFGDELIYNYCEVQPGMSGCAMVAKDGSYIGMVVGGYENESVALSIRVIDQVYEQLKDFTKS